MHRVRIKICGITRPDDAVTAADLGADAIGLVFYPESPRCVDIATAGEIISALPPFISKVGLFVNQSKDEVRSIMDKLTLDYLQFHGEESPVDCESYLMPYIKSVRMADGVDLMAQIEQYPHCTGLLLDTHVEGIAGGTGEKFNWDMVPSGLPKPVILAGGLTPENVKSAITQVNPYGVDVSSGVESSRGIKDTDKIAAFIEAVLKP